MGIPWDPIRDGRLRSQISIPEHAWIPVDAEADIEMEIPEFLCGRQDGDALNAVDVAVIYSPARVVPAAMGVLPWRGGYVQP